MHSVNHKCHIMPDTQRIKYKGWGEGTRLHRCNKHELGQTLGDGEGQGNLECCS